MPIVTSANITNIKNLTPAALPSGGDGFDIVGALDSADDYYKAGSTDGMAVGCAVGGSDNI